MPAPQTKPGAWETPAAPVARYRVDQPRNASCLLGTEVAIAAEVLNRMLDLGRPNSVRVA